MPPLARRVVRAVRRRARRLRTAYVDARDTARFASAARRIGRAARRRDRDLAIAVHLHYPETWPAIAESIRMLAPSRLPLYVTLATADREVITGIRRDFPDACCVTVPNRGRDVLPFLTVASALSKRGCVGVLKLHSKNSPHFELGGHWRDRMLTELVPQDDDLRELILEALRHPDTGVIGPAEAYFPLSTYWAGNADIVRRLIDEAVPGDPLGDGDGDGETMAGLGFFAGTMFWARLDALQPLLGVAVREFPTEPIPKDGTMAHALERAFCALPALTGRTVFASDGKQLDPVQASSGVPTWYVDATRKVWLAEQGAKLEDDIGGDPDTSAPGDER